MGANVRPKGLRIGSVLGIEIRVDWSWALIFLLISWSIGSSLGNIHPDWDPMLQWGVALSAALLFFISVVAHELAHSLVAKARGMPVHNITLFLFGGVSNIQREPSSPGSEFLMAIVGPLTSLIIGGSLILLVSLSTSGQLSGLSQATDILKQLNPVSTVLLWLGSVNLSLGVFNLIPGFPLDGGRVLRSALWALLGDLRRATRWASWVGQGIAWLMIATGGAIVFGVQIPILGGGVADGVWLALIGWFLQSASVKSYRRVAIQDVLEDISIKQMMRVEPPQVSPGISVRTLIDEHIMGSDEQAFPVLDESKELVGLVTLQDVREVAADERDTVAVSDIMTPAAQLTIAAPDEDAAEAFEKLAQHDVRQLPVLREGQLVGLLRRRDIIKWLQLDGEKIM